MATPRKYRGKYPFRINTVYSVSLPETFISKISGKVKHKVEMRVMLNNGEKYRLTRTFCIQNNYLLPQPGEEINLEFCERIM